MVIPRESIPCHFSELIMKCSGHVVFCKYFISVFFCLSESYAKYWCSKLADPQGLFASCHSLISPSMYKDNCIYDSCNCENSEESMCAAVSAYVYACAAAGIHFRGWRNTICGECTLSTSTNN
ncbi:hypothetical protein F7725_026931 [Dissostichus mawsoni]|uniref:VWF/SSPO/Zonadhesin-like cysteine-rich domain-containing protein n=1 Tax=Dissostichus mawsoni TaxID=36200 RepID=A0A7J5X8F3_DISMA|nr:hypothetical protein F7725_026931 [Dissostichus mawsoni]